MNAFSLWCFNILIFTLEVLPYLAYTVTLHIGMISEYTLFQCVTYI